MAPSSVFGLLLLVAGTCLLAGTTAFEMNTTATPWVRSHEQPCINFGGICVMAVECPPGQLASRRGLCPEQQARGVDCCHGLSVLERRCSARGGICLPRNQCGPTVSEERAHCPQGEICCIMVT